MFNGLENGADDCGALRATMRTRGGEEGFHSEAWERSKTTFGRKGGGSHMHHEFVTWKMRLFMMIWIGSIRRVAT